MADNRKAFNIWIAVTIAGLVGVSILGFQILSPYNLQKALLDTIPADGNLEVFTFQVYEKVRLVSIIVWILFLIMSLCLIIFRKQSRSKIGEFLVSTRHCLKQVKHDFLIVLRAISPTRAEIVPLIILLGIIAFGIAFRYVYLWRPMGHDEAYTFMAFASRGLRNVVTDYHLPNNHVFHTIMVNLFYQLLGDSPAVIRLPAFIAGVLIIPAVFVVARSFYDTKIGLFAASIISALPVMIDYSTNARGYTMITLFALVLTIIAIYLKDNINLFAWFLLILISSLGLYTNPTMVYPVGMTFTWLILSKIIGDVNPGYEKRFYRYLLFAIIGIGIVTCALYLPVVLVSGLDTLIGNRMVETLSWSDFSQSVLPRIRNTWQEWNREIPPIISITALIGLIASFFVPKLPRDKRVPLILAGFLWIACALLVQRVAPWPRIWLFLLPFFVIWIAAGIAGLLYLLGKKIPGAELWVSGLLSVLVVLPMVAGIARAYPQYSLKLNAPGEVEQVANFLQGYLQDGDAVVATSPDRVILDYYLLRRKLGRDYSNLGKGRDILRSIVLVNLAYDQTLESVLEARSYLDDVEISSAEEIYHSRRIILYLLSKKINSSGEIGLGSPHLRLKSHQALG